MRTRVYVDGFNLFYGALKGTPFKWLDPVRLASLLVPHGYTIDLGPGAGPFAAVEGLDGELDEELVGRDFELLGGHFDALPLLRGEADVLLDGLNHGRFFACLARAGTGIGVESRASSGACKATRMVPVIAVRRFARHQFGISARRACYTANTLWDPVRISPSWTG